MPSTVHCDLNRESRRVSHSFPHELNLDAQGVLFHTWSTMQFNRQHNHTDNNSFRELHDHTTKNGVIILLKTETMQVSSFLHKLCNANRITHTKK